MNIGIECKDKEETPLRPSHRQRAELIAQQAEGGWVWRIQEKTRSLDPQKSREMMKAKDSWPRVGQNNLDISHIQQIW